MTHVLVATQGVRSTAAHKQLFSLNFKCHFYICTATGCFLILSQINKMKSGPALFKHTLTNKTSFLLKLIPFCTWKTNAWNR